jgi:hypothetical protein
MPGGETNGEARAGGRTSHFLADAPAAVLEEASFLDSVHALISRR